MGSQLAKTAHSSSSNKTIQLEVNLVNVRPSTGECLLLHWRGEQALGSKADILGHDCLALTLASQSQRASEGYTGDSLLRRSDAAEVEALQREVDRFAAGRLESRGVVEPRGQEVLDGDVGLGLSSDANGSESDVDDVEAVPVETFVGADGLQGRYWDGDGNVVKLHKHGRLARGGYDLTDSTLTLAFC